MPKCLDLVGEKFWKLTVLERVENSNTGKSQWLCQCDCGNKVIVVGAHLKSGNTRSCGCWRKSEDKENYDGHIWRTRLYSIWTDMKSRCYNENFPKYVSYGARGIRICNEWLESFDNFKQWAVTHGYSDELTIDRINVNGNYEPSNCRWTTNDEQARNKTNGIMVTYHGKTKQLVEWCEELKLSYVAVYTRLIRGWGVEMAFERPLGRWI